MNKKQMGKMMGAGVGMMVGATVMGKMGSMPGANTEVSKNVNAGISMASMAMPIMGAGMVIQSTKQLYKKKKGRIL